MQEIFCNIDPFIYKQKIFKINTETDEKELLGLCCFNELEQVIAGFAQQEHIYTLHLCGDQKFVQDIGENLETEFNLKYATIPNIIYN